MIPESQTASHLTPSSFEEMRSCRLRYALRHKAGGVLDHPSAPTARLGQLCHRVMERLVVSKAIPGAWQEPFERLWVEEAAAASNADGQAPETWPGYAMKKVELRRALSDLNSLLAESSPLESIKAELVLQNSEGNIQGRLDLVHEIRKGSRVVDLKTGRVDGDGEKLKPSYRRQIQIYAYLMEQQTHRWPVEGVVLPLGGVPVIVDIDEQACVGLVREVLGLLAAYNSTVPAPQPAIVSGETCPRCPVAASCPAFWKSWKPEYDPNLIAYRGRILSVYRAANGRTAVRIGVEGPPPMEVFIQGLDENLYPVAKSLEPDTNIAAVGLRPAGQSGRFWLSAGGALSTYS